MAEAVAALYAVETVVEGAAVGAYAVSKSTVPLHLRFRELKGPPSQMPGSASLAHSLNVVKGKAYIFGGDVGSGNPDAAMRIITLPNDIKQGEPDYQLVKPEFASSRPLQKYSSSVQTDSQGFENVPVGGDVQSETQEQTLLPRSAHGSTSIDSDIFVLAGRTAKSIAADNNVDSDNTHLFSSDSIYSFSTQTNEWSILEADVSRCKDGLPQARFGASCASTPHPQPDSAVDITTYSHGTIFLHGGYDEKNQPLRDTWAFDVNSKVWVRWPDLPDPLAEDVAGEGRITCVDKRLWRAGDGFGRMMYLDFDVAHGDVVSGESGPISGETSIMLQDSRWHVISFGDKAANTALQGEVGAGSEKTLIDKAETLPVPRQGAGFTSVQVGAGRRFLLYFMGQDGPGSMLSDVWSFQIQAENKSPAAMKDAVRSVVGKSTGENEWARCEIIESTKNEGLVETPGSLTGFAADTWVDLGGGNVVLWGGIDSRGSVKSQCWIMSVE